MGARPIGVTLEQAAPAASAESALIGELRAGSEDAFAYLVSVYQNPVYEVILHVVENRADAADVLQDVFLKIFRGIRRFRAESSLKTWIYRIAVHEASNHRRGWLRRLRREPASLDEGGVEPPAAGCDGNSPSPTPFQELEEAERRELVKRALSSLSQPYRTVVVLREVEGLTYEEIAEVLGVAEGTVKSRLMRGRELLRRKLHASLPG